ncbi:hypothetical protein [Priestia aryabhattai]|uniref:hypothetical protein n=1 Tax=Priestia aryabhattai TaxID=412384 RepID=UPI001C8D5E49|nr:hypothetical protein [Priestia aryabhattai]MBX9998167.1 hypothetical protein [Priestia aryabhattai]
MSIFQKGFKKKYYPITSSNLDYELKNYVVNKLRIKAREVRYSMSNSVGDVADHRYRLVETIETLEWKVNLGKELSSQELKDLNNFVFLRYPRYSFSLTFGPYILLLLIASIVYFFYGVLK